MTVRAKLIVAGTVLAAAVGYLAFAGVKGGWVYYMDVDKFVADTQFHGQRVRLHGKVAADSSFKASSSALLATFNLQGISGSVAVEYRVAIPDMFQCGRDVVVEGKLDPATQTFRADVLMTKCASKYESASPHATEAGGMPPQAQVQPRSAS